MTALERMQADPTTWDSRYGLPLCPLNGNPWIYSAYADLILRINGDSVDLDKVVKYFIECSPRVEKGLFYRWPGRSDDQTSHDEIMGAAHFHPFIAITILAYLEYTHGNFNLEGPPKWPWQDLKNNVYRFVWLKPYLLSCAGLKVNLIRQVIFALHICFSGITNSGPANAGGRLRNWLMLSTMRSLPLVRPAAKFWVWRISKKDTLRGSLAIEPREAKSLSELAPEEWGWP